MQRLSLVLFASMLASVFSVIQTEFVVFAHEASAEESKPAGEALQFNIRSRTETKVGSGRYHTVTRPVEWEPKKTALVVCDMWDLHHCLNATRRGAELAPRMNRLLAAARDRGVTVIHAPSSCMDHYKDHVARRHAIETPRSKNLPKDIGSWCTKIPREDKGKYPIDQSDGGEDDDPKEHDAWAKKLAEMGRNPRAPWKQQTDLLEIKGDDYISDNGEEIWSIMEARSIDNVILVGVHTNMCVLGRPFGLRQMSKNGKNVILIRDMTDTMYNPRRAPHVSHFTGTDLIVEHIEKYVCPTATSDQLIGGKPFRFKNDKRPRLVIVMAEREYKTDQTLPEFAVKNLGKHFSIDYVFADENERNDLPGIEALAGADVALISVRRRALPKAKMAVIRNFVTSGKPLVGIRTASHAFAVKKNAQSADLAQWPEFDAEVLGGNYSGHYGGGPETALSKNPEAAGHPILASVDITKFVGKGSLYKTSPVAKTTTTLLTGQIPGQSAEPVAWTNECKFGGRVFYTSLGHPDDFQQAEFNRLLRNAVYWAAGLTVSDAVPAGF